MSTKRQNRKVCSSLRCISSSSGRWKLSSFPSKAEFSQIEGQTSKTRCRLFRSWNRALANRSLPAEQSKHQDKKCLQLHHGMCGRRKAQLQRAKTTFFLHNEGLFKASTSSLVSQLHAHEKWQCCGNHNYQKQGWSGAESLAMEIA